jgi:hypothetical protein
MGKNDWLFLRRHSNVLDESRGIQRLTSLQIDRWVAKYVQRKSDIERQGAELLLVVVPNKHSVYKNKLPEHHFQVGHTITDMLMSELESRDVGGVIDLRPVLQRAAESERVYGRYNTHWNDRGAYYAYQEIMKYLPSVAPLSDSKLVFRDKFVPGDLSKLLGNSDLGDIEKVLDIESFDLQFNRDQDWNKSFHEGRGWSSRSGGKASPTAFVLCDSFTNTHLYKYLAATFEEAHFKHHMSTLIDFEVGDYDYVIYVIVERLIPYRW